MARSPADRFMRWLQQQPTPLDTAPPRPSSDERQILASTLLHTYAIYGNAFKDRADHRLLLAELPLTPDAAVALLALGVAKQLAAIEARIMTTMTDVMAGLAAVKTDFETFRDGVTKALSDAAANATNPADVQAAVDAIAALDTEIKSSGAVASAPAPVQAAAAPTDASAPSA